ncbi:MAG: branched-chain amino acid ABC transporter permease [Deltaproteobacteria bacterium]|nr:branched-chain amino acid ABC transporter permease [Deltaproteobacteria bacterium]
MLEFIPQLVANGIVLGSIYVLVALGLTLIFGIIDVVNFAHGEFYMVGAFVAFLCVSNLGLPYPVAIVATAVIVGIFGFITEKLIIRSLRRRDPHPINYVLVTVGLSTFLLYGINFIFGPDLRRIPSPYMKQLIHFADVYLTTQRLLVVVVAFLLVALLSYFVKYSSLGNQMRATAQNFTAARIVGVNTDRVFASTFIIGSMLAGIAGALVGAMFVTEPAMGIHIIVKAFIVVIVGGMGSIIGSIVAGLGLGLLETVAGAVMPAEFLDIIGFSIMILVLLTKPTGLFGSKGGARA